MNSDQTVVRAQSSIAQGQPTFDHASDQMLAVHAEDVSVAYGTTIVVEDVDLELKRGALCGIIGPNGAGKSTFMKAALGLVPLLTGWITVLGHPFHEVRNHVAYVPQTDSVNWDFPTTVFDVALMGRYVHKGWIKRVNAHDKEIARWALETMGMIDFVNRQISELSGGQRQRVFLARALASQADLFLLDEPLAGVDKKTEELIMSTLQDFAKQGKTVVVVHHDLATVTRYFDHVCLFNRRLVAAGTIEDAFTTENIEKTFGIHAGRLGV